MLANKCPKRGSEPVAGDRERKDDDMVVSARDAIDVIKVLYERLNYFSEGRQAERARFFKEVIEESFQKLELIHKDYTENLSQLSQYLQTQELPPRKLLVWLRDAGIKYRADRDYLWTIKQELAGFDYGKLVTRRDRPELQSVLSGYVKSIIRYYETTMSPSEWSFYRDYEHKLDNAVTQLERSKESRIPEETLAEMFYKGDTVKTTHDALIDICDKRLPERWVEVSTYYRSIRGMLGYPT
jgi:hypothetical protein